MANPMDQENFLDRVQQEKTRYEKQLKSELGWADPRTESNPSSQHSSRSTPGLTKSESGQASQSSNDPPTPRQAAQQQQQAVATAAAATLLLHTQACSHPPHRSLHEPAPLQSHYGRVCVSRAEGMGESAPSHGDG